MFETKYYEGFSMVSYCCPSDSAMFGPSLPTILNFLKETQLMKRIRWLFVRLLGSPCERMTWSPMKLTLRLASDDGYLEIESRWSAYIPGFHQIRAVSLNVSWTKRLPTTVKVHKLFFAHKDVKKSSTARYSEYFLSVSHTFKTYSRHNYHEVI